MIRRRALDARPVARDAWTAAFPTTGSRVRNTAFLKRWCNARLSNSTFVASDERSRFETER